MYNDDFSTYAEAKKRGLNARSAYELAERNGLDNMARIRMLIQVFGLTIGEAKEVTILDSSSSLDEHQEKLLPALEKATELGVFSDMGLTNEQLEDRIKADIAKNNVGKSPVCPCGVRSKKSSGGLE